MTELYKYFCGFFHTKNAEILKKKSVWICTCSLGKKPSSYCVLWCQKQDIDGDEPIITHLMDMDSFVGIKKKNKPEKKSSMCGFFF